MHGMCSCGICSERVLSYCTLPTWTNVNICRTASNLKHLRESLRAFGRQFFICVHDWKSHVRFRNAPREENPSVHATKHALEALSACAPGICASEREESFAFPHVRRTYVCEASWFVFLRVFRRREAGRAARRIRLNLESRLAIFVFDTRPYSNLRCCARPLRPLFEQ